MYKSKYGHPNNVQIINQNQYSLIKLANRGLIAVDESLLSLWKYAAEKDLEQILLGFQWITADSIRCALACLCEAGLLERVQEGIQAAIISPTQLSALPQSSSISVIIVTYNSRDWLETCLSSLNLQTLGPLETILIDNGSAENPASWLEEHHPDVIFHRFAITKSLATAINRGVELASGEYFLLLNPDTKLQPDALAEMLSVVGNDPSCAAVAPLLKFSWSPAFLNGLGNYAGPFSWGTDNALGHLDLGQFNDLLEVPSACFAATLIPRVSWEAVGPLDESFPLYYEDIEWSYRARLLGYHIRAAPQAIVYHAYSSRIPTGEAETITASKLANVTYGRLRFAGKIFGIWRAAFFILTYALDDFARAILFLLRGRWESLRAYSWGWKRFLQTRREIWQQRKSLQSQRKMADALLLAQQKSLAEPFIWRGLPELTWDLITTYYLPLIQSGKTKHLPEFENVSKKLLIISNEIIDTKMAGPGMRYLEMARALMADLKVTLAIPGKTKFDDLGLKFVEYDETRPVGLRALVETHDVTLVTPFSINKFPFLSQVNTPMVVDLYDPYIFENLFYYLDEPLVQQADINLQSIELLNHVATLGDFFICGSERQRDLWLGLLLANRRVNPYTFAQDQDLRRLIDVVGIGIPDRSPVDRPFLRGTRPEFPQNCRIVLWGGGVWDWLDPLTLVKAWPQIIAKYPEARLVFLGTRHPNPDVPQHRVVFELESLTAHLGEKDRTIFFFEWLSYVDREALLCEADVGVTLHSTHIETHFSIRTRVLDYIWTRLPIVISDGDVTSEWVKQYGLGRVVPPQNSEAVAQAILEILEIPKVNWSSQFTQTQDQFNWSKVVEPLRQYSVHAATASDRQILGRPTNQVNGLAIWRSRIARARYIWRNQGGKVLLIRFGRQIRRHLTKLF